MNAKHAVGLSSTEIAALWTTYITETMSICLTKHFIKYMEDNEVKPILTMALELAETHIAEIRNIFEKEKFPIPQGFTDADVDLSAPSLFFDLFPLSYAYTLGRMGLLTYGMFVTKVAREDIRLFFTNNLHASTDLYNKSVQLMLEKGIYDRPPFIPYPEHAEFLKEKETFLSKWLEPHRPLNVLELSEMFFIVERNYFGLIVLTAFIQVTKDEKIKSHLIRGKELALKQINFINETLIKDDLLGNTMVNTEVTTSNVSPFSDRLILNLVNMLNSTAVTHLGQALSVATRFDLAAEFVKLMNDVLQYGKDGMDILIERNWFEEPPHAPDRKALAGV
ncbi:DUF3231 family protein [Paenibacillus sp. GCM10027628]|uniref:DUF3231 family protein n=1 Tax=Paenibacillus sp. GCM10027628 TaxID=3273413 RepID=UPI0036282346